MSGACPKSYCSPQCLHVSSSSMQNVTPTWLAVHSQEDAKTMLSRAIETMAIAVSMVHVIHMLIRCVASCLRSHRMYLWKIKEVL